MRIVLFDEHPLTLNKMSAYFLNKEGVEVMGIFNKRADVIALLAARKVDILVADIETETELSLELFEEIQRRKFDTKVIVYSEFQSDLIDYFLYEYGVVGIMNKIKGLDDLGKFVHFTYLATKRKKMRRRKTLS